MKISTIAIVVALGACMIVSGCGASALDIPYDLRCIVKDTHGDDLVYLFNTKTENNGSLGGTYFENGFVKNGTLVIGPNDKDLE